MRDLILTWKESVRKNGELTIEEGEKNISRKEFVDFLVKLDINIKDHAATVLLPMVENADEIMINQVRNDEMQVPVVYFKTHGEISGIPVHRHHREIWNYILELCK